MKLFFCHVIHHFSLVFDGELIANYFKHLKEIDCKRFQVPQGHIGHHGGRQRQGQGGVHHVADEIIFLSCCTSFQPSFWRGIDCKLFQVPQGHVRHHGGRQHQGQGGVHQVVDEIIYYHFLHPFGLVFFSGKSIEKDFMYSGKCWPWWKSTSRIRSSSSIWWNYILSYYTSLRPSFWWETDCKWFQVLRIMLDTRVDVDLKDKEESTRDLLDTKNANYWEGNLKRKYFFNILHSIKR